MGQVIGDNTWVANELVTKGTRREDVSPELVGQIGSHLWVEEDERANIDAATGQALTGLKDTVWIDGVSYGIGTIPPADVIPKVGAHMWVQGFPPVVEEEPAKGSASAPQSPDDNNGASPGEASADSAGDEGPPSGDGEGPEGDPDATATVGSTDGPTAGDREFVGTPPAKGGKNSGTAVWLEYATANGVVVPADSERHEVIAALESAGVPTE